MALTIFTYRLFWVNFAIVLIGGVGLTSYLLEPSMPVPMHFLSRVML